MIRFRSLIMIILLLDSARTDAQYPSGSSGLVDGQMVKSVFIDSGGIKWFGTANYLVRFDGITWSTLGTENLPVFQGINDIWINESGENAAIWIASASGLTLADFSGGILSAGTTYDLAGGLLSDNILSLCTDSKGRLYAASSPGVNYLENNTWKALTYQQFPESLPNAPVRRIHARKDSLYIATGDGIGRIINSLDGITGASRWTSEFGMSPLSGNITSVFVDSKGNQWFGTSEGLQKHEGILAKSGWFEYTLKDGLPDNYILTVNESPSGEIWIGTRGGAAFLGDGGWQPLRTTDGLASDTVYDIAFDRDSSAWLATHRGISHYKSGLIIDHIPGWKEDTGNPALLISNDPTSGRIKLNITVNESSTVDVSVFQVSGRLVNRLSRYELHPGLNQFYLAIDQPDRDACPGIFICLVQGKGWKSVSKLYLFNQLTP